MCDAYGPTAPYASAPKRSSSGAVLGGECIGLEPVDDGLSHAWFGPVYLGKLRGLGRGKNHFEKHQPVRTTGDVE
jgi:hypothetical protein